MSLPQVPPISIPDPPSQQPSDVQHAQQAQMHRLSVVDVQRVQQQNEEEHMLKFNTYHSASLKKRLAIALRQCSYTVYCWEIMQIMVTIYAMVIFIFEMDCQECKNIKPFPPIPTDLQWLCPGYLEFFSWSEVVICVLFVIDIVYCILIVEDFATTAYRAYEFIPDLLSMAGLAAIYPSVPIFLSWLRILRPYRLLRQMRVYRTFWTTWAYPGTVAFGLTELSFLLFASMYCIACFMVILEREKFQSSWFVGFYYSCVTITTVGYGDYYPETPLGRIFVIGFLIIMVTRLPAILDNISALLVDDRKYRKTYRRRHGRHHVIVAGQYRAEQVKQFVQQLHDNDVGESVLFDIVLLGESAPSDDLRNLLRSPSMSHVFYSMGNPTSIADLKRCQFSASKCLFILADPRSDDKEHADAANVAQIRCARMISHAVPIYVQIHFLQNQRIAALAGASEVIGIQQVKAQLLASNVMCRGSMTLIANLIKTYDYEDDDGLKDKERDRSVQLQQYARSRDVEAYPLWTLPQQLVGLSFVDAANTLYQGTGNILIAVRNEVGLWLNPGFEHRLQASDLAIVLARDGKSLHAMQQPNFEFHHLPKVEPGDVLDSPSLRDVTVSPTLFPISTGSRERTQESIPHIAPEPHSVPNADGLAEVIFGLPSSAKANLRDANFALDTDFPVVRPVVIKRLPEQCTGHIVYIVHPMREPWHFVLVLRNSRLHEHLPIVFLTPEAPDDDIVELLTSVPNVYVVVGNPRFIAFQIPTFAFDVGLLLSHRQSPFGSPTRNQLSNIPSSFMDKHVGLVEDPKYVPQCLRWSFSGIAQRHFVK